MIPGMPVVRSHADSCAPCGLNAKRERTPAAGELSSAHATTASAEIGSPAVARSVGS